MNENKLEKFRASLKVRMGAVVCYNAAVLVCIALGLFHLAGGGADNGFIVGFNLGLCVGVTPPCATLASCLPSTPNTAGGRHLRRGFVLGTHQHQPDTAGSWLLQTRPGIQNQP